MPAHRLHRGPEAAVTVIEAMIVVLVVGTLLALAVPTFFNARSHDRDVAAQQSLRAALTAADVIFTGHRNFDDADVVNLTQTESSLRFEEAGVVSSGPTSVSVATAAGRWAAAAQSASGTCYLIAARSNGHVSYGSTINGPCTGATARTRARATNW